MTIETLNRIYLGEWVSASCSFAGPEIRAHLFLVNSCLFGFKSNGNEFVEEGELSFVINLSKLKGSVKIGENGNQNSRFVNCSVYVFVRSLWLVWRFDEEEYNVNFVLD